MVEADAYCVDVMKQMSAMQASIERANRLVLRNHLETWFSTAIEAGSGDAVISELVDALKFNPSLTGPGATLGTNAVESEKAA